MRLLAVTGDPIPARSALRHRRQASRREDAVTVLAGLWLVLAVFSDGWAHTNAPQLEGFFTPWHAALYAGLVANAVWIAWLARRSGAGSGVHALPVGYFGGALGVGVFAAGGLADLVWHETLGVETGIDALLSPPHLGLLAGGLLILTSALRSRWAAGDSSSSVALAALVAPTALVGFFLVFISEFAGAAPTVPFVRLPEGDPRHEEGELPALVGLGAFLVTTVVYLVPLLLVWQRGRAPRGAVTAVVGGLAWLSAGVVGFPAPVVVGVIGATGGALVADVLVHHLECRVRHGARPDPVLRLPVLAAVSVVSVWVGHLGALAAAAMVAWPPALWSGIVVLSAMVAVALGALATGVREMDTRAADQLPHQP